MAKVSGNGRYISAASRMPAGDRKPVGRAPKGLSAEERDAWNTIAKECPWADSTHRRWILRVAVTSARADSIAEYFRKRQKEFAADGKEPALAFLGDDGKRHHLMTDLLAAEEGMRKLLAALGANPSAQVKMMTDITKASMPVGAEVEGSPADRSRFFT